MRPLVERGADTLVLGCTHYPFVSDLIADIAGANVTIVDPAAAVARELRRRLDERTLVTDATTPGRLTVWSSGATGALTVLLERLGLGAATVQSLPV